MLVLKISHRDYFSLYFHTNFPDELQRDVTAERHNIMQGELTCILVFFFFQALTV